MHGLLRGHAGRRLVHQDQVGVLREQQRDLEPLGLAMREIAGGLVELVGEADELGELLDARRCRRCAGAAARLAKTPSRLQWATSRFSRTVSSRKTLGTWNLRPTPARAIWYSSADLVMSRSRSADRSGCRLDLAADDVERGGLAGAVGPDQAAQFALLHAQVEPVDRPEAAEADAESRSLRMRRVIAAPRSRSYAAGWCRAASPRAPALRAELAAPALAMITSPRLTSPFGRNRTTRMNSAPMMSVQVSRNAGDFGEAALHAGDQQRRRATRPTKRGAAADRAPDHDGQAEWNARKVGEANSITIV